MGLTVHDVRSFIETVKETLRAVQRRSQEIEGMHGALKIVAQDQQNPDPDLEYTTDVHRKVVENVREVLLTLDERIDVATSYAKFLKISDDVTREMQILHKDLMAATPIKNSSKRNGTERDQMETQRQNIQQLFLQSCNSSKNCIAILDEKIHAQIDTSSAKNNISDIMERLNSLQSDLIQAWSADKIRESRRLSKVAELHAKANQLIDELRHFHFQPFLHLSTEPSFMVSSLEHSYSQIARLRDIVKQLEDWPKTEDDPENNLSPAMVDQAANGQVC